MPRFSDEEAPTAAETKEQAGKCFTQADPSSGTCPCISMHADRIPRAAAWPH